MPSPFPGMDPYLEAPDIWPDCHNMLSAEIRNELNRAMPSPYYARLDARYEVGIVDDDDDAPRVRIIPDVAVVRRPRDSSGQTATAVLERSPRAVSASIEVDFLNEPITHTYIEIRDSKNHHQLVTLIEILSPSNKRGGPDRLAYAKKQAEVLQSAASLVEIDLLRSGTRILPDVGLARFIDALRPIPDYLVMVAPAWKREGLGLGYHLYPIGLREILPCVGIPLKVGEAVVPLDLQDIFNRVYDLSLIHI